jgi:hypothetical protein
MSSITPEKLQSALLDLGLTVETDGKSFVHTTRGRYAPILHAIVTPDDDGSAATIMVTSPDIVPEALRARAYELLNLVHGQRLWNVRFHLDDEGRMLAIGKFSLWGKPLNGVQLGDVLFSLLVSLDRLYPCLRALIDNNASAPDAFERFFLIRESADGERDEEGPEN